MSLPTKRLRHRMKLQADTSTDGAEDPSYTDYATGIPCDIKPVTGGERYLGKQLQAETTLAILTRYNDNFLPTMRAVNEETSVNYAINRLIDVDGRQHFWLIEATEVVV